MVSLHKDTAVIRGSRCAATFNRDADGLMHGTVHGEFLEVSASLSDYSATVSDDVVGHYDTEADAMLATVEHACWGRH